MQRMKTYFHLPRDDSVIEEFSKSQPRKYKIRGEKSYKQFNFLEIGHGEIS